MRKTRNGTMLASVPTVAIKESRGLDDLFVRTLDSFMNPGASAVFGKIAFEQ
jgi:hypothetical protein